LNNDKNKNNFTGYELEKGEYQLKLQNNAHELNKCENSTIKINLTNDLKWDKDPNTNVFIFIISIITCHIIQAKF